MERQGTTGRKPGKTPARQRVMLLGLLGLLAWGTPARFQEPVSCPGPCRNSKPQPQRLVAPPAGVPAPKAVPVQQTRPRDDLELFLEQVLEAGDRSQKDFIGHHFRSAFRNCPGGCVGIECGKDGAQPRAK